MVLSLNSNLGSLSNDYDQFALMCKTSMFQMFINRTSQSLAIYDFQSKKCEFISDIMKSLFSGEEKSSSDKTYFFDLFELLDGPSYKMIVESYEPLIQHVCELNKDKNSKLCFTAYIQCKNKSWKLLQSYPLKLSNNTPFLLCSTIADLPASMNPILKCTVSMLGEVGREEIHEISIVTNVGPIDKVSKREMQVLQLLCKGKTSKEISEQLFVSFETVKKHRQNILEKTGCKNTVELMNLAMSMGVI